MPSRGGHSCCTPDVAPVGPANQADVEARADVLVYSTPTLDHAIEVTGPVNLTLYAASSAVDTDWTAKLVDVFPDGHAINLNNGIVRARFRKSLERPTNITPGQIYKYEINVWPTSNVFCPATRSASRSPAATSRITTGTQTPAIRLASTPPMWPAFQTVYHDAEHVSVLTLPIMPEPVKPAAAN